MPKDGRQRGLPSAAGNEGQRTGGDGITPLAFMLALLRDEDASLADRKWAADKAAPYCHQRLGAGAARDDGEGSHESALDALA